MGMPYETKNGVMEWTAMRHARQVHNLPTQTIPEKGGTAPGIQHNPITHAFPAWSFKRQGVPRPRIFLCPGPAAAHGIPAQSGPWPALGIWFWRRKYEIAGSQTDTAV